MHVIQYEHGGIPYEPLVTQNGEVALEKFQELVTQNELFRDLYSGESLEEYYKAYWRNVHPEYGDPQDYDHPFSSEGLGQW